MVDNHWDVVGGQQQHEHHLHQMVFCACANFHFLFFNLPDICPGHRACPAPCQAWGVVGLGLSQVSLSLCSFWLIYYNRFLVLCISCINTALIRRFILVIYKKSWMSLPSSSDIPSTSQHCSHLAGTAGTTMGWVIGHISCGKR